MVMPGSYDDADVGDQALHPELRIVRRDLNAGEAAGIAAFVGEPDLHAAPGGLFHGEFGQRQVLR